MSDVPCKNLVYFTIGGAPEYTRLLEFVIHTIKKTSSLTTTDILVMCDEEYSKHVQGLDGVDDIMIVPKNDDHIKASMRKVEIFSYQHISNYDKVLFLDCDIVVVKDLEMSVFPLIEDATKLHVFPERMDINHHKNLWWSLEKYKPEDYALFAARNQHVFNCGQFAFRVNDTMKQHFQNVIDLIKSHKGKYFYEQSFMNHYFNTNFATCETLLPEVMITLYESVCSNQSIVHFAGAHQTHTTKLQRMQTFWDTICHL